MQGYVGQIEQLTEEDRNFRSVLFTARHMQLVLMALKPREEIGSEVHTTHDQFFRIEKGKGEVRMTGAKIKVAAGDAIIVPAGTQHNLINTGKRRLRLYTLYTPPNHAAGLVEATKVLADAHELARQTDPMTGPSRKPSNSEGLPATSVAQ